MTFDDNKPQTPVEIDENEGTSDETPHAGEGAVESPASASPPEEKVVAEPVKQKDPEMDRMNRRLERLGGEPAPVITPEEFARLQKAGQVHIDARGRVRTERPRGADPGVSLRKRRAWYASGIECHWCI